MTTTERNYLLGKQYALREKRSALRPPAEHLRRS